METSWETDLAGLLNELSEVQGDLLDVLARKRQLLMAADTLGMQALQPREQELVERLEGFFQRRRELLGRAKTEGLPCDSIRSLSAAMPGERRKELTARLQQAGGRTRLLQHHALTNWVLVQRSMLHLSQLLEIIATGGRQQPTYGRGEPAHSSGSLVDRAV